MVVIMPASQLAVNEKLWFDPSFNSLSMKSYGLTPLSLVSAWPGFRGDRRHSGNSAKLVLVTESATVSNIVLLIAGLPGSSNLIQTSTNLTTWSTIATTNL